MPYNKDTKHKHLTLDDRQEIMECLDKNIAFKAIARRIGKDPTTVSKEVKKHLELREAPAAKTITSDGTVIDERRCPLLLKAPFACNPCDKRRRNCGFQKQLYIAKKAQAEYEALLVSARDGVALNKEEFWEADAIITEGIKKGQRLYHIMESGNVSYSKSSAYRNLHRGFLSISKTDMPRVVKFKQRKQPRKDSVPKVIRKGRTFADFQDYIADNDITSWVEMDTVIGRPGGKVIMTFDFTICNFMFGLLLDKKTADEAASKIQILKASLKKGCIGKSTNAPPSIIPCKSTVSSRSGSIFCK